MNLQAQCPAWDPADGCSFCKSRVIFVMVYVFRCAKGTAVPGCPGCYPPSPKGKPRSFENPPLLPERCGGFCWGKPDDPNQYCCLSCTFLVSPQHPEAGQLLLLHQVSAPWCWHCCCPQCSCWSNAFCGWPRLSAWFWGGDRLCVPWGLPSVWLLKCSRSCLQCMEQCGHSLPSAEGRGKASLPCSWLVCMSPITAVLPCLPRSPACVPLLALKWCWPLEMCSCTGHLSPAEALRPCRYLADWGSYWVFCWLIRGSFLSNPATGIL